MRDLFLLQPLKHYMLEVIVGEEKIACVYQLSHAMHYMWHNLV